MVIIQRILRGVGKEIKNNTVYDFSQSIFKVILYLGKRTWYDYKLNLILREETFHERKNYYHYPIFWITFKLFETTC